MHSSKTYLSIGDFIDLYFKIKERGWIYFLYLLRFTKHDRILSKWDHVIPSSDFWNIPEVRRRWNAKCTGDPALDYEDYVVTQYLREQKNLKMLSVGCGSGSKERKFGKYANFERIEGIDIAGKQIALASKLAEEQHMNNLYYRTGRFEKLSLEPESYDVILFNSSLHHFESMETLIREKVVPILKPGGLLVIFEYVGPNRLQWTSSQLKVANDLLKELPASYRVRWHSKRLKNKIHRPGLLRMMLTDPSEAVESEAILPVLHTYLNKVEEKKIGWDITHLLFKHIAHHFNNIDPETCHWLQYIFEQEDKYLSQTGRSDAVFGIYRK